MKQAPKWNEVTIKFARNAAVAFADVDLSASPPPPEGEEGADADPPYEHVKPGLEGWPTIRHYNRHTGTDGQMYTKQTDMAMCDELGPKGLFYMQRYVESAGETLACNATELATLAQFGIPLDEAEGTGHEGCDEKEIEYIKKAAGWSADKIRSTMEAAAKSQVPKKTKPGRLKKKVPPKKQDWAHRRLSILTQFMHVVEGEKDEASGKGSTRVEL